MIDLSARVELSVYAQIARAIKQAGQDDFFLCGATARVVLLEVVHGLDAGRATLDVDFGVMVESLQAYQALRQRLVDTGEFVIVTDMTRLRFGNTPVDLIPFGGVEADARLVTWPPGDVALNTLGYQEALRSAVWVRLPLETDVRVASLPTQALLKLIAWGDRNLARRSKDAPDFGLILRRYEAVVGMERLTSNEELLARPDMDVVRAGAWMLGFDAGGQIREHSEAMRERVIALASEQSDDAGGLELVAGMGGPRRAENLVLLQWFTRGLLSGVGQS